MGGVSWTIESSPVAFGEAAGLTFDLKGLRDKVGLDRGEGEDLGGVILRSELGSLGVEERLLWHGSEDLGVSIVLEGNPMGIQ